jgi:ketosteroid isomerase-like protein
MQQRSYFIAALAIAAVCGNSACSRANDEAEINASVQRLVAATNAKDINAVMEYYSPDDDLFVFDATPPRQFVGAKAFRKDWEQYFMGFQGPIHAEVSDWKTEVAGNLAYGHGLFRVTGTGRDGKPLDATLRVTDIFKKIDGKWRVVHEHASFPVDPRTGKADLNSKM